MFEIWIYLGDTKNCACGWKNVITFRGSSTNISSNANADFLSSKSMCRSDSVLLQTLRKAMKIVLHRGSFLGKESWETKTEFQQNRGTTGGGQGWPRKWDISSSR